MDTNHDYQTKYPPEFVDYLKPSPFIRSWMLPYLPDDPLLRDYLFFILGMLLSTVAGVVFHWLGFSDIISGGIAIIGWAVLGGDFQTRYMIAGAKFSRAKKLYSNSKSSK